MSITLTPRGQQALEIQQWVMEDPQKRAREGAGLLSGLAREAVSGSQELAEIQDAGLIVTRLLDGSAVLTSDDEA